MQEFKIKANDSLDIKLRVESKSMINTNFNIPMNLIFDIHASIGNLPEISVFNKKYVDNNDPILQLDLIDIVNNLIQNTPHYIDEVKSLNIDNPNIFFNTYRRSGVQIINSDEENSEFKVLINIGNITNVQNIKGIEDDMKKLMSQYDSDLYQFLRNIVKNQYESIFNRMNISFNGNSSKIETINFTKGKAFILKSETNGLVSTLMSETLTYKRNIIGDRSGEKFIKSELNTLLAKINLLT